MCAMNLGICCAAKDDPSVLVKLQTDLNWDHD